MNTISSSPTAGYTLLEMVVVVLVMGIIAVLSTTRLRPAIEHGKVSGAAGILAADIQYAQVIAARQRKPVVIIVDRSVKQYLIRDRATTTEFRTRFLGTDTEFTLDSLGSSLTSVEIFPNGITRQTTTFTVGLNGFYREVILSRAGQIRVVRVP